jgi:putative SOS response-associated peptidase YedK
MCGRFSLNADPNQLKAAFPWLELPENISRRYNVAPGQPVAVVPNDGKNSLDFFLWGLIPFWADDPKIGNRLINARAETVQEKPSFRNAFKRRRCLVLADGFYEWKKIPGQKLKQPVYLKMSNDSPFAFAGLWENWEAPDGSTIKSCTIITTEPNQLVQKYHNRMPVILEPELYQTWLTAGEMNAAKLQSLLRPYTSQDMTVYLVSKTVNNPANDSPECILPLAQ